jgi:hypothetical protein
MAHNFQKRKGAPQKKATIFFLSAMCFTLLVTPVYASYSLVSDTDFPSPNLSFESPDQEVQFIQKECLLIFTSQSLLILRSLIETGIFYLNRDPVWEAPFLDKKFSSPRC